MRRWALRSTSTSSVLGLLLLTGCGAAPTPPPVDVPAPPSTPIAHTEVETEHPPEPVEEEGPGLTEEQISEVLAARSSLAVGGCHAVEYSGRSPEPGFVVVNLAIERTGQVRSAKVSDSSYRQGSLPQCVASVTRELHFPPAAGDTQVTWRFDFKGK